MLNNPLSTHTRNKYVKLNQAVATCNTTRDGRKIAHRDSFEPYIHIKPEVKPVLSTAPDYKPIFTKTFFDI